MKNQYSKIILAAGLLTLSLSSCLKDDFRGLDHTQGVNVIEFANPGQVSVIGSTTALYSLAYPIIPTATTVPVTVSYSGTESVAPEDITVNVAVLPIDLTNANDVVKKYNDEQHTTLVAMDPGTYTMTTTSVVIPKGQSKATFNVTINTSAFVLTKAYALPLKITSVSSGTISGNFSTIILNLAAKNKYDGKYKFIATASATDRPTFLLNTEYTYQYDVELRTTGPNSVNLYNSAYGDFLIPLIVAPSTISGLGSTNLELVFNPTTNKITSASNKNLNPANGRTMTLDATATTSNYWDPVTKDVYATFFVNQPGFGPLKYVARFQYLGVR
jgi:hypothetical protein